MNDYTEMTPEERFAEVDRMARELIGSARWKSDLARRYGITPEGVGRWMREGAPVWPCVALRDALAAQAWEMVRRAVLEAEGSTDPMLGKSRS